MSLVSRALAPAHPWLEHVGHSNHESENANPSGFIVGEANCTWGTEWGAIGYKGNAYLKCRVRVGIMKRIAA